MWQPRSLRNSFDNKSGAPPGTTCPRSTPINPAISTGSMAKVLVSSVSSLPKRKVLAFLSWTLCTQGPSSCEHLSPLLRECCVQSGSLSILCQSHLSQCSLVCSDLLRNRQRRMFSTSSLSVSIGFPLFGHSRAQCPFSRQMRQPVREIISLMLSRPSTRYGFPPLVCHVTGL